eukprot:1101064-Amphidinium_carterae.1
MDCRLLLPLAAYAGAQRCTWYRSATTMLNETTSQDAWPPCPCFFGAFCVHCEVSVQLHLLCCLWHRSIAVQALLQALASQTLATVFGHMGPQCLISCVCTFSFACLMSHTAGVLSPDHVKGGSCHVHAFVE